MNNYYFSNKSFYADCTDPITDIQKIRNQASGAYLSLLDNDSVGNDVLSNYIRYSNPSWTSAKVVY